MVCFYADRQKYNIYLWKKIKCIAKSVNKILWSKIGQKTIKNRKLKWLPFAGGILMGIGVRSFDHKDLFDLKDHESQNHSTSLLEIYPGWGELLDFCDWTS